MAALRLSLQRRHSWFKSASNDAQRRIAGVQCSQLLVELGGALQWNSC
jgi:hypothetical protein